MMCYEIGQLRVLLTLWHVDCNAFELDCDHARVGGDNLIEFGAPAAGNDHLVAALVERLGEPSSDSRSAAGDEDGVACEFHAWDSFNIVRCENVTRGSGRRTSAAH